MTEAKTERLLAIAFVIALHVGLGTWLLNYSFAGVASPSKDDELLMQIVYLPPRSIPPHELARTLRPAHLPRATRTPSHASVRSRFIADRGKNPLPTERSIRRLQLALPDALRAVTITPHDPLAHARPSVEYVGTRFDGQWASSGNAVEQAASRHPALAVSLSLFGGLRHICTEDDKRRRMRGCSPAIDAGL